MPSTPIRVPAGEKFLNPDGTVSRAWVGFFNILAQKTVQGPTPPVVDNTAVKWDGTSGRLVK